MKTARLIRFFNVSVAKGLRAVLVAVAFAGASSAAVAENRSDLWWNPAEAGQGLIVIDHETDLFVVWCTYDWSMPMWFVMPGGKLSADGRVFEGTMYETFSAGEGYVAASAMPLGTAKIDFAPDDLPQGAARFTMRWGTGDNFFVETHVVTRQAFGTAAPEWGRDATDMWWDPTNPGWGVAAIQHGAGDIFSILLAYDYSGNPTFSVVPSRLDSDEFDLDHGSGLRFSGDAYTTSFIGSHWAFDPSAVQVRKAGFTTMRFRPVSGGPTTMDFATDVDFVPDGKLVRLPFGNAK